MMNPHVACIHVTLTSASALAVFACIAHAAAILHRQPSTCNQEVPVLQSCLLLVEAQLLTGHAGLGALLLVVIIRHRIMLH